jgi:hypothetical protein
MEFHSDGSNSLRIRVFQGRLQWYLHREKELGLAGAPGCEKHSIDRVIKSQGRLNCPKKLPIQRPLNVMSAPPLAFGSWSIFAYGRRSKAL